MPNNDKEATMINFDAPERTKSIIKVIGVGGGGGNAVGHMYTEGIKNVSFLVCNTDAQALKISPVPVKLQLGSGLGAGNKPAKGREEAEKSVEDIKRMLNDGTKMTFITAGMGGGTGTGASPIIAQISKELGILTVGIVTIPFKWEGKMKINQALDGVEEIAKNVDALLVINNTRLAEIYPDISLDNGFAKADETLTTAAKSISEIISNSGTINVDFEDVNTILRNGGAAIISTGYGEGEDRLKDAITNAINSPLLNDSDIYNSERILFAITHGGEEGNNNSLMMDEMNNDIGSFMSKFKKNYEIKWGMFKDPSLGNKVKISILASGFGIEKLEVMSDHFKRKSIEEDIKKKKELEEIADKEAEKAKRRAQFYGPDAGLGSIKPIHHPFIFKTEDLDNEDIIQAIEENPAFTRSKQQIADIQTMSKVELKTKKTNDLKETHKPIQGTISFGDPS